MEKIDNEYYASLEVAKLLKQAGFDWKVNTLYFSMQDDDYPIKEELIRCTDYFPNGDQRRTGNPFHNWNQLNTKRGDYYTFVSKKNFLEFDYEIIKKDTTLISAPTLDVVQRWLREVKDEYVVIEIVAPGVYKVSILGRDCTSKSFKTYEEALEACIKKALELILEKGE